MTQQEKDTIKEVMDHFQAAIDSIQGLIDDCNELRLENIRIESELRSLREEQRKKHEQEGINLAHQLTAGLVVY